MVASAVSRYWLRPFTMTLWKDRHAVKKMAGFLYFRLRKYRLIDLVAE